MRTKSRTAQDCKERNGPVLVRIAKPPPQPLRLLHLLRLLGDVSSCEKTEPVWLTSCCEQPRTPGVPHPCPCEGREGRRGEGACPGLQSEPAAKRDKPQPLDWR